MAWRLANQLDYEDNTKKYLRIKILCIGERAVGKTMLMKSFLHEKYKKQVISSDGVTLYRFAIKFKNEIFIVDFWVIAGQKKFKSLHPTYYCRAHACLMVIDVTRKKPYKHIKYWYKEILSYPRCIPVVFAANKIDVSERAARKVFDFPARNRIPVFYVSAFDGTNVRRVFKDVIRAAVMIRKNPPPTHRIKMIEDLEKM